MFGWFRKIFEPKQTYSDNGLPDCNWRVYTYGSHVATLDGWAAHIEEWIGAVREKSHATVDWHYVGGRAVVKHLGNEESRARVLAVMEELRPQLNGTIMTLASF